MGSINDVIEAFRRAPTNVDRGTLFEKLMVRFFQLDPALAQQYEQVWRWMDWPERKGKPDTGIDLVARERDTGAYTAIQCKFYEPTHTLAKADIDSFFTASGKKPFTNRVIISTTDKWGTHAEDALDGQSTPVQRINLADIAESPIDWDIAWPADDLRIELAPAPGKQPRPHQLAAIEAVLAGYAVGNDRGKLIMACGTGKTFTALKLAERIAADNAGSVRVLFLVPSISLLSQSLREWTAQTALDIRAFAVCSDTKVGRLRNTEDFNVYDVPIPVTTNPATLMEAMAHRKRAKGLTVVFCTYQSLPTVADAQTLGLDDFDLAICDEAHRTTGVTLADVPESNFVRIHDDTYLRAARRLYMTATPRIYADAVKDKADQHSAELVSMDDELRYGPEFHHLSFGDAVEHGLLTDYKVLVLTVDESVMAAPLQQQQAIFGEIPNLDDASKIVGCWNGLAKRAGATADGSPSFSPGEPAMQRAVAFAKDIATSKQVAELFPRVVAAYQESLNSQENDGHPIDGHNRGLVCEVHHVDGTFNALQRNEQLSWLKSPIGEGECRILTNARCLSEGVDVPALDAVLFLHPRNSIVDVVQSVGRVMRLSPGKDYGYVILPVAVPAGIDPAQALADNVRFKVVWQVLNALRSHDERFDAMINSIALNRADTKTGQGNNRLLGGHIGPTTDDPADTSTDSTTPAMPTQMALFSLSAWQEAIYTRIVDKVGTRVYWDQWAADVADIAQAQITRINTILNDPATSPTVTEQFKRFLKGLRDNLNDTITGDDAISMLSQHLITKPVFDALFAGHDFAAHNPVSRVMQAMVDTLDGSGLQSQTTRLDKFYDSVRLRAAQVVSADGKQHLIAELYEKFFQTAFKKQSDALGIVYTPIEVVDFILRAADHANRTHLGKGLTDEGVHILDGFTGTGTFLTRLLQSGLITPADLERKYAKELHANEIMLLAYYIGAVNIETTYHALTGKTTDTGDYQPFPGIVLADTFQIHETDDTLDAEIFATNNERITTELATPISVIVGNPPYSVGQSSANDLNANTKYPTLDGRIEQTYAAKSTATNKNSLYDSYIRAFRWATDRIDDAGIVAFVSNGGWIDANTADGMRLSLADDYSHIYIYNLRGNQRTAGELSRKEGGKIFGAGSRNTVAIFIGIQDPQHTGPCQVHYTDIGEYLTREQKLQIVADNTIDTINWQTITPSPDGDWINQRDETFGTWPAIGEKRAKTSRGAVFKSFSRGLESGRDVWVYNYSRAELSRNIDRLIANYNKQIQQFAEHTQQQGISRPNEHDVADYLKQQPDAADETQIKWSRSLRTSLARRTHITRDDKGFVAAMYRPFCRQHAYFDRYLNHERSQLPSMFITPHHNNIGFYAIGVGATASLSLLMTDEVPDVQMLGAGQNGQFFPRWAYEKVHSEDGGLDFGDGLDVDEWGYRRIDNITDDILALYENAIGEQVDKDDIFHYLYGVLHDPDYRTRYAADLKKMLPHIPTPDSAERFKQVVAIGRRLAELHLNYEAAEPYPLDVQLKPGTDPAERNTWRVEKMRWRSKSDRSAILYNSRVTIAEIPDTAHNYLLGSRTALEWLIDRYQVKTDKASGIVNDPNIWCDEHDDPTYIVELIKKVITVSVKTTELVGQLRNERA